MFRKFQKQKTLDTSQAPIDLKLLEKHLDRIKVSALEIRGFRQKKITKSPTLHFMKNVDLEEAWPSCRDQFFNTYNLLCHVAQNLQIEYGEMSPTVPFGMAIDQFSNLIDRITIFLETTDDSSFSQLNLRPINRAILEVQHSINVLQRRVMVDFVFTRNSAS